MKTHCTKTVKSLPAVQETRIRSLDQETPWRRKWQPTPVLLLGKSYPWLKEPGRLQSILSQRVGHGWATSLSHFQINKQKQKSKGALFLIFGKLTLSMEEKNHHSPPLFHSGPNSQKEPWSYSCTSLVYRMKSGTLVEVYSVFGRSCSCCSFRPVYLLQLLVITSVCQKLPRVQQATEVGNWLFPPLNLGP